MAITNTLKARLMIAAKTANTWATYTQVPLVGELCFETDTLKLKVGNGTDTYAALKYVNSFPSIWLNAVEKFKTSPTGTNNANGGPSIIFKAGNDFNSNGTDTTHKYIDIDINADHTITVRTKGIDEAIQAALENVGITVKGGNKITEVVEGNTVTLNHDTTAVNNLTSTLQHGDKFTAASKYDQYGHVIQDITYTLPTIGNGTVNAGVNTVVTGVTTTAGVVTAVNSVGYKDIVQDTITGGNHITVSNTTDGIKIDHKNVNIDTATAILPSSSSVALNWQDPVATGLVIDSYGHVAKLETNKLPANPVSAAAATSAQLMKSDGDNSTSPSGFTASNSTITTTGTANATTLPTVKAIIDYIGNVTSTAMHYKGAVASYAALPTTSQAVGDVYVLSAKDATGPYEKGDYFIWNGTRWDVITGENQIEDKAATITDTMTTLAVADGISITAKVPTGTTTQKGIVQLTNIYTSDNATQAATGQSIKAALSTLSADVILHNVSTTANTLSINDITQRNGLIAGASTALIDFGDSIKVQSTSTNKFKLVSTFVDDLHNSNSTTKTASAKQIWNEFTKRNVQFVETGEIEIDPADLT